VCLPAVNIKILRGFLCLEILVPNQYLTENRHPDQRPDVSVRNGTASGIMAERNEETMEMGRRGEGH
jgi:hypothetical protein